MRSAACYLMKGGVVSQSFRHLKCSQCPQYVRIGLRAAISFFDRALVPLVWVIVLLLLLLVPFVPRDRDPAAPPRPGPVPVDNVEIQVQISVQVKGW
jgi:hypothetical protein